MGDILDIQQRIVEQVHRLPGRKSSAGDSIMVCCPFHDDNSPSAGVFIAVGMEIPLGYLHCFDASERVVTNKGTVEIGSIAGEPVKVVDGNGDWIDTTFESYGRQFLWELELTRNGVRRTVLTTGKHRWHIKRVKATRTTDQLRAGDYLESVIAKSILDNVDIDPSGVRCGFAFGDGSQHWSYGKLRRDGTRRARKPAGTRIRFCGGKDEIRQRFFPEKGHVMPSTEGDAVVFTKEDLKYMPSIYDDPSFIMGFLAGYFAADGCVASKDGSATISSASKETLEAVRDLMTLVGIASLPVRVTLRTGYLTYDTPLYSMTLVMSTVPEGFFLRSKHALNASTNQRKFDSLRWKVVSARKTRKLREVFCCEVPTTQSFMLADNLLTGNCLGCGAKGRWNVWAPKAGLEAMPEWEIRAASDLVINGRSLVQDESGAHRKFPTLRAMMEAVGRKSFIPWPNDVEWRGYGGKMLGDFGAVLQMPPGADLPVCFLPVKIRRSYVGGVAGYLEKRSGRTSYLTTRGSWVKDVGLLGYDIARKLIFEHELRYVVIAEGPRDMLRLLSEGIPAVAGLGTKTWTDNKQKLIEGIGVSHAYGMADNDKAGDEMMRDMRASFRGSPVRYRSIKLPKDKDKKGKLIKLDPDCCPVGLMDEIMDMLEDAHGGTKRTFFNPHKIGWARTTE